MLFSLKELVRWLGMTVFELWLNIVTLLIFSIIAVLKLEGVLGSTSWWHVFIPLFACDGLNAYFCVIVFIRMYKDKAYRAAILRLVSSVVCLVCLFVFKFLLCQTLNRERQYSSSEIFVPLFICLQVLMVRACQQH